MRNYLNIMNRLTSSRRVLTQRVALKTNPVMNAQTTALCPQEERPSSKISRRPHLKSSLLESWHHPPTPSLTLLRGLTEHRGRGATTLLMVLPLLQLLQQHTKNISRYQTGSTSKAGVSRTRLSPSVADTSTTRGSP